MDGNPTSEVDIRSPFKIKMRYPIEKEKFLQTDGELVAHFGATSTDSVVVSGRLRKTIEWYKSTLYVGTSNI